MSAYTDADLHEGIIALRRRAGLPISDLVEAVLDVVAPAIAARAQAEAVEDLAERLGRARGVLNGRARDADGSERSRLDGKANGVALALSYVEEIQRTSHTP